MTVVELVQGCQHVWPGRLVANGGYSEDPDTFHLEYDSETESITEAIIRAVTLVKNVRYDELPPLMRTVDPDAVESLFGSQGADSTDIELSFVYEGIRVTVDDDENIWLSWQEE